MKAAAGFVALFVLTLVWCMLRAASKPAPEPPGARRK
jgi:hypothetical protein